MKEGVLLAPVEEKHYIEEKPNTTNLRSLPVRQARRKKRKQNIRVLTHIKNQLNKNEISSSTIYRDRKQDFRAADFQAVYLSGWRGGHNFLNLYNFAVFIAVMLIVPVGAFAIALSFYKVNNRPFIKVTENAFRYFTAPKIYVWKKRKSNSR